MTKKAEKNRKKPMDSNRVAGEWLCEIENYIKGGLTDEEKEICLSIAKAVLARWKKICDDSTVGTAAALIMLKGVYIKGVGGAKGLILAVLERVRAMDEIALLESSNGLEKA